MLVPAFFYAFQTLGYGGPQLMQLCLATSLATIIVTSLRSVMAHNKKGAVDWDILRSWGPGIAVGAIIGVLVASALRTEALQALFGLLGMVIGAYLGLGKSEWRLGDAMPKGMPPRGAIPIRGVSVGAYGDRRWQFWCASDEPVQHAHPPRRCHGGGVRCDHRGSFRSGFLFLDIAPEHRPPLTIGAVNLVAFAIVVAMTMITAPWGVKLAHAMDPKPLKRVFAVFLTLVALNMLRKALGL